MTTLAAPVEVRAPVARFITLTVIQRDYVPLYFDPPPSRAKLRRMLHLAGLESVRTNPTTTGGTTFYLRAGVERWLRRLGNSQG